VPYLRDCGYRKGLLRHSVPVGAAATVPLVGYAYEPFDARSSCIAVIDGGNDAGAAVLECRGTGAPVVFVCFQNHLQWWKQTPGNQPSRIGPDIPVTAIADFFRSEGDQLAPQSIYRAKTEGRFKSEYQLHFVDVGLMPVVEEQIGVRLSELLMRVMDRLKSRLKVRRIAPNAKKLFRWVFWLLAAKILHDKEVESFIGLNLCDAKEVFHHVDAHYRSAIPIQVESPEELDALGAAASEIAQFASLINVTTESLAYLYENTLVTRPLRRKLGIHSTPAYLADYMVWRLADWIKDIPPKQRNVLEPSCGAGAFLLSAMRLLREGHSKKATGATCAEFLRDSLRGFDTDSFALELARLRLTLADVPNPDGWKLEEADMFAGDVLQVESQGTSIFLANPPFGRFDSSERNSYKRHSSESVRKTKEEEMLARTLAFLPTGSVFGVVLPQGFLHSESAKDLRQLLATDFEMQEVCLLPDGIFTYSDAETAILLGRRHKPTGSGKVRYRRVREPDRDSFINSYSATTESNIVASRFTHAPDYSLQVPDLDEAWIACNQLPKFGDVAEIGQGLVLVQRELEFWLV